MRVFYCFLLVLVLISTGVLGNGAVFQEGLAGAGVIPVHEDEIKLVKEFVVIDLNRLQVNCTFMLKNLSNKSKSIQMGFPFEGKFDSYDDNRKPPLDYFEAFIDNKRVSVIQKESEIYDYVYIWDVDFFPGEEKQIECNYDLTMLRGDNDLGKEHFSRGFKYITHTGQYWASKIDNATFKIYFNNEIVPKNPVTNEVLINVSLHESPHYMLKYIKSDLSPADYKWHDNIKVATYEFSDWEPIDESYDIVFRMSQESANIEEYFEYKPYAGHSVLYSEIDTNKPYFYVDQFYGYFEEPTEEERLAFKKQEKIYHLDYLRYLRNEIYARHGYVFKDKELTDFFSQCSWYQPNDSFDFDMLTKIELDNVALIKAKEKEIQESIKE